MDFAAFLGPMAVETFMAEHFGERPLNSGSITARRVAVDGRGWRCALARKIFVNQY